MINLDQHIAHLLLSHDCVTVPGLGAFIAAYVPACYDAGEHCWHAPCRSLAFNQEVSHNDGALAASVARREGVTYECAVQMVAEAVDYMLHQLDSAGEYAVERVGRLCRAEAEGGAPVFEPAADCVANAPYSLYPLLTGIVPVAERPARPVAAPEPVETGEKEAPTATPRRFRPAPWISVAASAAIVGCLVWNALTAVPFGGERRHDTASMAPAKTALTAKTTRPSAVAVITDDISASTELFIAIPAEEPSAASPRWQAWAAKKAKKAPIAKPADRLAPAATGDYCIVVASLPTRALAEKHIRNVGDPSLQILESDGRYRVYAATAPDSDAAAAARAQLTARYPDAWVCRR